MKSIGYLLKELRTKKGLTLEELADSLNKKYDVKLNKGMVSKWEGDKSEPSFKYVKIFSDYYNVSVDFLLGLEAQEGNSKDTNKIELNEKDEKDIEKALNATLQQLESQEGLMLSGNPVDESDWEFIKNAIKNGLEYSKKVNKEKYTPKKYKK